MHLTLTPQVGLPGQPEMTIRVAGDSITIDGVLYDLAAIPEGGQATAEGDHPFIGPIKRQGGTIYATVIARLGDSAATDQPDGPWVIKNAAGIVAIPAARRKGS